ncbi:PREDICTED: protein Gawky isoform X2 [Nicrophorus vespilloides]|uniref:Protein Gawky isoform X2 n=1 Tax=Nicrophorus vespilloides TaxID=110193 RepID=A0ABM1NJA1_NICVS|nr:PREDICTED: protein Gawky isoform X2 [Nicrophorus vespilloides]
MRAPVPSEPNYTFPTYQVPQVSAMRGRAPPVQVARTARVVRAEPPSVSPCVPSNAKSVIYGSSCPSGNSNLRMQSVTENCLLNSVTVPKIQRNVAHNNSDKLACKSGALLLGQDIPGNQKADNKIPPGLTTTQYLDDVTITSTASSSYSLARLIEMSRRTRELQQLGAPMPAMRLLGGGESSINTGTSGWGSPPTQQASNNNANTSSGWGTANPANQNNTGTQQWNNNANRPPTSGPGNTNQDVNKANSNLPPNGQAPAATQGNTGWGQAGPKPPTTVAPPTANSNNAQNQNNQPAGPAVNSTTKQQLEQLTNMREAIFSQDGWGGQHVNQDTNWDIPSSPEPQNKMDGSGNGAPHPWKPTVNNGTELWEANLRSGGQPPPPPQQKTPWGHTPSSNIGGTWGEEDDAADSSNVWTGVPSGQQQQQQQQQWSGNNSNSGTMWGGPKKENDWTSSTGNTNWGDPRAPDPRASSIDLRDMRPDPRDMRPGSTETMRIMDPREQMRIVSGDMRGDPRGITGRLNGSATEGFWAQSVPQASAHHIHPHGKTPVGPGNGGAGWEEPSPPSQRRNMPNYDDGTSLWGNPQQGSHWKDLPTGGGGAGNMAGRGGAGNGPPGMAVPATRVPIKGPSDGNSVWRNGGGGGGGWVDEPGPGGVTGWGEDTGPWPKQKSMGGGALPPLWPDNDMDWSHKQGPKKQLTPENIWNSKQFRGLIDMGYKKEDAEHALRVRDMNMEEALDFLNTSVRNPSMDGWNRRHEDHYDHQQFPGQRGFPSGPSAQLNFQPGNNTPNLLNNMGNSSAGGNNSLINNMSPAIVQKMLSQVSGVSQGNGGAGGRSMQPQSQPSTAQLRMLVQQIQMAVQAGYLNHQILNQPLAPQTLILLNQLLQQIKNLQHWANQQTMAQSMVSSKQNYLQYSLAITKTKQQIQNLQNQIAAQQANYVKQQQQQQQQQQHDMFKSNPMHETLHSFSDLVIKDNQNQGQSRLTQWKLPPTLDKDEGGDFSRAPGSVSKPLVPSHSSPNLNPLGLTQTDGPWSSGRSNAGDGGWPDSAPGDTMGSDIKDVQWAAPSQPSLTDLVPEFEPGKPWKGNQKSIEDDPTITPGSVVRSPLSLPTIKDSELFNINPSKSPPPGADTIQPLNISSSTWTFNPPSSSSSAFTSPQNKVPSKILGGLNPSSSVNSELWGAPKRGPPPGLSTKSNSVVNGWGSNISSASTGWGGSQRSNWVNSSTTPWLLLRNLTAQIDGSTLRTLCLQHGPLQSFHLYLHQGFALAKYSTNEEAVKAQNALNNCVLGNTTILAENPTDWEATSLLREVANQQGSSGGWRGGSTKPTAADTWSTSWSNSSTTSLWGSSTLDTGDQSRATPSSLQSFLPENLLGGETM